MMSEVVFEHACCEYLRALLRLEHQFIVLNESECCGTTQETNVALGALLEIVRILDRPDLKGKLIAALSDRALLLRRYLALPDADEQMIKPLLSQVDESLDMLQLCQGKFYGSLLDDELLASVKQHVLTPGGAIPANLPMLHAWQQQAAKEKSRQLKDWRQTLSTIEVISDLLLSLLRRATDMVGYCAEEGFFGVVPDTKQELQLIRLLLPEGVIAFPEISAGRHRVSIHFFALQGVKKVAVTRDFAFKMALAY